MKSLGLDSIAVETCVDDSMEVNTLTNEIFISFFEEDRYWQKKFGVVIHPSISINNITYRGDLDGFDIFKAICAGFLE